MNACLRKIVKTRGHFPNGDAPAKLIWLALRNITADCTKLVHHWKAAMNQFAILYAERFVQEAQRQMQRRLTASVAPCSARANCGSSPCSPP